MQHASKFQLIEITTYLFLSISLDKVTISVLIKLTCNMHLNFRNLNFIPTKNLLSKFHNLYIYIYVHQWSFHRISFTPHIFIFLSCNLCICICIRMIYMLYRFIGVDKFI